MDALNHNEDEEYTWSMEMQQLKEKEMKCHVKSLAGKFYPGNYLHPYTSVILKSWFIYKY